MKTAFLTKQGLIAASALLAAATQLEARQITVPLPNEGPLVAGPRYQPRFEPSAPLAGPAMIQVQDDQASYTLELAFAYNCASKDMMAKAWGSSSSVDTLGVDLTLDYALNDRHSLNLRFGYASGDNDSSGADGHNSWSEDYRIHDFYLMPGYRYTYVMNEQVSLFAGVNAGVNNHSIKVSEQYDNLPTVHWHGSAYGFAYSAEAGLRFRIGGRTELTVAYQFSGSTTQPKVWNAEAGYKTTKQYYHSIRIGMGVIF